MGRLSPLVLFQAFGVLTQDQEIPRPEAAAKGSQAVRAGLRLTRVRTTAQRGRLPLKRAR